MTNVQRKCTERTNHTIFLQKRPRKDADEGSDEGERADDDEDDDDDSSGGQTVFTRGKYAE